jgi:uncharacterized protein (TIGR02996 family)
MTLAHEQAFLAEILAQPDDDAPRLVFADWLDDHGEGDRAEFIRAQVELYRLPEGDPRRPALVARVNELAVTRRKALLRGLPAVADLGVFHRGFLEEIALTARQFLSHGGRLRRGTPLRLLGLSRAAGVIDQLAASPLLDGITSLHFAVDGRSWLSGSHAVTFAASPHLHALRTLKLPVNPVGTEGVWALADSPALANLAELDLGYCGLGVEGAQALAGSSRLTKLSRLNLECNDIGDEGLHALIQSPTLLAPLTWLNLRANGLSQAGAEALAACPHLRKLTHLNLLFNHIRRAGATALAQSPYLQQPLRERFERLASSCVS